MNSTMLIVFEDFELLSLVVSFSGSSQIIGSSSMMFLMACEEGGYVVLKLVDNEI